MQKYSSQKEIEFKNTGEDPFYESNKMAKSCLGLSTTCRTGPPPLMFECENTGEDQFYAIAKRLSPAWNLTEDFDS